MLIQALPPKSHHRLNRPDQTGLRSGTPAAMEWFAVPIGSLNDAAPVCSTAVHSGGKSVSGHLVYR